MTLSKRNAALQKGADLLFAAAEKNGFVEDGWEIPRLTAHEIRRVLSPLNLSVWDYRAVNPVYLRLSECEGEYWGQFYLRRKAGQEGSE